MSVTPIVCQATTVLPSTFRTTIAAWLLCIAALPLAYAEAQKDASNASVDQALAIQEQRELTLAKVMMSRQRPDLACELLKPTTAPDSTDSQRLTLLARCSSALKQHEEALAYYHRVIALEPQAAAARVELAGLYLAMGRRTESAQSLAQAAQRTASGEASNLINRLAESLRTNDPAALANNQAPKPWSVQLYVGLIHDDNVNAGPLSRNVPAIVGGVPITFELLPEAMPRSSWGATVGIGGSYVVPVDQKLLLLFQGSLFATGYFSESDFRNDTTSLAAALIYRDRGFSASVQPNLRYTRLGGRLQESVPGVVTRVTQQLSQSLSVTGSAGYFERNVRLDRIRDADAWNGSLGLIGQVSESLQIGGEYEWQRELAQAAIHSRRLHGPSMFAALKILPELSLIANYRYSSIKHDERMALFAFPREDRQKTATLTTLWDVSRWTGRNTVLRAEYTNIDNPSNIAFNRFERNVFSVGLQTQF